jgi:hypothetical protein
VQVPRASQETYTECLTRTHPSAGKLFQRLSPNKDLNMTIQKHLDCSTSHIKLETKNWLESVAGSNAIGQTVASYEYGFFISVPETPEYNDAVPHDLRTVLDLARQHGCTVLRLDSSGDTLEGMPTYDW